MISRGPRATRFRPRMSDVYDPDPKFAWIVELAYRMEITDAEVFALWMDRNGVVFRSDTVKFYGTLLGFVDHDDAMLFYLAHV